MNLTKGRDLWALASSPSSGRVVNATDVRVALPAAGQRKAVAAPPAPPTSAAGQQKTAAAPHAPPMPAKQSETREPPRLTAHEKELLDSTALPELTSYGRGTDASPVRSDESAAAATVAAAAGSVRSAQAPIVGSEHSAELHAVIAGAATAIAGAAAWSGDVQTRFNQARTALEDLREMSTMDASPELAGVLRDNSKSFAQCVKSVAVLRQAMHVE